MSDTEHEPEYDNQSESGEIKGEDEAGAKEIARDLREYINACTLIKEAKAQLKEITGRKNDLENKIKEYMVANEIGVFNTSSGNITMEPTKTLKPINKEFITQTITDKVHDNQIVQELTEAFEKRPVNIVNKIKIVPPNTKAASRG